MWDCTIFKIIPWNLFSVHHSHLHMSPGVLSCTPDPDWCVVTSPEFFKPHSCCDHFGSLGQDFQARADSSGKQFEEIPGLLSAKYVPVRTKWASCGCWVIQGFVSISSSRRGCLRAKPMLRVVSAWRNFGSSVGNTGANPTVSKGSVPVSLQKSHGDGP